MTPVPTQTPNPRVRVWGGTGWGWDPTLAGLGPVPSPNPGPTHGVGSGRDWDPARPGPTQARSPGDRGWGWARPGAGPNNWAGTEATSAQAQHVVHVESPLGPSLGLPVRSAQPISTAAASCSGARCSTLVGSPNIVELSSTKFVGNQCRSAVDPRSSQVLPCS